MSNEHPWISPPSPCFENFFSRYLLYFFLTFAHFAIFYILQISTTTKTCGSSDLQKLIPAQKSSRENYFQPNWGGKIAHLTKLPHARHVGALLSESTFERSFDHIWHLGRSGEHERRCLQNVSHVKDVWNSIFSYNTLQNCLFFLAHSKLNIFLYMDMLLLVIISCSSGLP